MKNTQCRSDRYVGGAMGSHFTPKLFITSPILFAEGNTMTSDEDDKVIDGSDPKTDHASALELDGEFYLVGDVTGDSMLKLGQSMLRVAKLKSKKKRNTKPTFRLNINTPGGVVNAGLMLGSTINRIRNDYGIKVDTYVMSQAASMGFIVSQFGDTRYCDVYSSLMIHDLQALAWGDTEQRRRGEEGYKLLRGIVANILATRNTAGHNDPEWWIENYLVRDTWFSAQEALSFGLVDQVVGGITLV